MLLVVSPERHLELHGKQELGKAADRESINSSPRCVSMQLSQHQFDDIDMSERKRLFAADHSFLRTKPISNTGCPGACSPLIDNPTCGKVQKKSEQSSACDAQNCDGGLAWMMTSKFI